METNSKKSSKKRIQQDSKIEHVEVRKKLFFESRRLYQLSVIACALVFGVVALYRGGWISDVNSKIHWERISPAGARFAISFPTSPQQLEKQLKIPSAGRPIPYQELAAETRGAHYSVSYLDFPRKWKLIGSHSLLRKSLELLMEHEGQNRRLAAQSFVSHRGYPALDYIAKEGNREIHGRLVIVGNTLFKIDVNHPSGLDAAQESFFASFDPVVHERTS